MDHIFDQISESFLRSFLASYAAAITLVNHPFSSRHIFLGTHLPGFGPPFGPPSHSAPNSAVFSGIEGSAKATHPRSSLHYRHLHWRGAHHVHKRSQILPQQTDSPCLHYELVSLFWILGLSLAIFFEGSLRRGAY